MLTTVENAARVWDAATGKEIAILKGHDGIVFSAAFSPDRKTIVTASFDKTARLWETAQAERSPFFAMRHRLLLPSSARTAKPSLPPRSTSPHACGKPPPVKK